MKKISIVLVVLLLTLTFAVPAEAQVFYFDVYNHWAEKDIYYATNEVKIFNGYGDWTFRPDNNISIAEYFKIIYQIGNINQVININTRGKLNYTDIDVSHWAYTYISSVNQYMVRNNSISYTIYDIFPGEKLNPQKGITRYQAALLTHILNLPPVFSNALPFKDLSINDKFYEQLLDLYNNGIFLGYSSGEFRPNSLLTRAEAASISRRIHKEASFFNQEYLSKIIYSDSKYDDGFPLFYPYDNKNLSSDDFEYIRAITSLEYKAFGGYVFPEDEGLYDANPVNTLRTLKENSYFNKTGVNFYLLKFDQVNELISRQYSNSILNDLTVNAYLTNTDKMTLLHEIIQHSVDSKIKDYLLKFKDSIEGIKAKSDIDFLLIEYYLNNNKLAELYEWILKYNNLDLDASSFVNVLRIDNSIPYTTKLPLEDQFFVIEKYLLNITYSLLQIGFESEAINFLDTYHDRLLKSSTYKIIYGENSDSIIGTLKNIKYNSLEE